jgi:hypothetical protein
MANKRFSAKKVGDQYVLVPQGAGQEMQRGLCTVSGSLLAILGLKRGGFLGLLMTVFGAGWAYHGITGRNPIAQLLCEKPGGKLGDSSQTPSHQGDWKETEQLPADNIDEAAMESFPASDPPAPARHS